MEADVTTSWVYENIGKWFTKILHTAYINHCISTIVSQFTNGKWDELNLRYDLWPGGAFE